MGNITIYLKDMFQKYQLSPSMAPAPGICTPRCRYSEVAGTLPRPKVENSPEISGGFSLASHLEGIREYIPTKYGHGTIPLV